MPSTRTLLGRLSSGAGRWGRRSAQKAPHKAAKDPYEPDLLGRLFRLCLTALRRIPTTSEVRQIRTGVMYRHGVLNLDLPFAQLLLDRVWLVFR